MAKANRTWAQLEGRWDFSEDSLIFRGQKVVQNEQTFQSVGLALSSESFAGGRIEADVSFQHIGDRNTCDLTFFYDPANKFFGSAGLGGGQAQYTIRHWDPNASEWKYHAYTGDRTNIKAQQQYHLAVDVQGSRVQLEVDGVKVLSASLPFMIPPSQVGVHCIDEYPITIKNFQVQRRAPKVFVLMQFSSPYNEIHQEVIKKVCEEFKVEAVRADDTYGPGIIIADVVKQINEATFIIAEITPANPNVYYELGYAHALRKPVILVADRSIERLPFDVSSYRTLFYENTIAGRTHFEQGLRRHIAAILGRAQQTED